MNPNLTTPDPALASGLPGPIAVTGAGGLIGGHVAALLAASGRGDLVCLTGRRPPPLPTGTAEIRSVDLRNPSEAMAALEGCKSIVHAAGRVATSQVLAADPLTPIHDTVRMAMSVLEAAQQHRVERLVLISSTTGYALGEGRLTEADMLRGEPPTPWLGLGAAARYVEKAAEAAVMSSRVGLNLTCLRPTMVYGPFDDFDPATSHFLPAMVRRVVDGERPISVLGDGRTVRDLIHAADVARASLMALGRVGPARGYTIGSGEDVTVLQTITMLAELIGEDSPALEFTPFAGKTPSMRCFDVLLAERELRFRHKIGLHEGLKHLVEWYRATRGRSPHAHGETV